jgi:hypothetical protein
VEEQLQAETVSDGVRRGGFLHPIGARSDG